ncbi:hypothetical protein B4135_2510 [Caldibacillus debilis]|uniref:Uncharacterized protein n=1 Tax=Caldibacillus debilis TaxID=301148 RepID=A0A150LYZ7_9BACI|nr:hypothetical protein B4135_2510 [Caldibacillus debilis]
MPFFSSYEIGLDDEKVVERYGPRVSGSFSETFFCLFLAVFFPTVESFGTWPRFVSFSVWFILSLSAFDMALRQSEQKLFHPDLLHKGCF